MPTVEIEKVPVYLPKIEVVEVVRPFDCEKPRQVSPDDVQNTDDALFYLMTEYQAKYNACLDSLGVYQ